MSNLLAGLLGVVVGSFTTTVLVLVLLRRLGDRELIERRLRLCLQYRDSLGDLAGALDREGDSARVIEQAWTSVAHFCREFRLTSWVLTPAVREKLAVLVGTLEDRYAHYETRPEGQATGKLVLELRQRYHAVDRILRGEIAKQTREFHAFRLFRAGAGRRRARSAAQVEQDASTAPADDRPADDRPADDSPPDDGDRDRVSPSGNAAAEVPVIPAPRGRVGLS